jgi:hypothetical protein
MKKIVIALGLVASFLLPTHAQGAQATLVGTFTDIASNGATVPLLLSNPLSGSGYYIQECIQPTTGARPTICNNAAQLWISNSPGASFTLSSVILLKPSAAFTSGSTSVDCFQSKCGVFLRLDHTKPIDFSEDQFIPLSFKVTSTVPPALASDSIVATLNGVTLSTSAAIKLAYRTPATLAATSAAGAVLTFDSLAPECARDGMKITALKGAGLCNISISSPGTATSGAITMQYPIELTLGVQKIPAIKIGTKLATVTNFGEKVQYKASGSCQLKNSVLSAKTGTCTVKASAPGRSELYSPLSVRVAIKVK